MRNRVSKIKNGKNPVVGTDFTRQQSDPFQLKSGPAKSAAQLKVQDMVNTSPRLQQLKAAKQVVATSPVQRKRAQNPVGPQPVVQRTIWRYTGSAWQKEYPDDGNTTHASPEDYCTAEGITPDKNDKYSQASGDYYSFGEKWSSSMDRATSRKRPKNYGRSHFDEERASTAYGYLKPPVDGKRQRTDQGPHLLAHAFKRSVFDVGIEMGFDPQTLLDSKLAPKPRKALTLLREMIAARGLVVEKNYIREWYYTYKKAYETFEKQGKGWKKEMKKVLEAHPLTVYRVGEVATAKELEGKGEKCNKALEDLKKLLETDRSTGLPVGLVTVDAGYVGEGWDDGDQYREDFIYNYAKIAIGAPPSPNPYVSAPSSPVRDDEDDDELI
ncbi:hypothetical protein [Spirosoma sp.]|uniref:hypothetical protein n=1 Tax=Spirosoma sp. TaxID=1899569 RepID=UPI002616995E|nr:hypothetical protein [Spirosoma sp.]MCX6219140.1 hypothetical protein [Spirosoma sp.]